jgi:hypothetical protein
MRARRPGPAATICFVPEHDFISCGNTRIPNHFIFLTIPRQGTTLVFEPALSEVEGCRKRPTKGWALQAEKKGPFENVLKVPHRLRLPAVDETGASFFVRHGFIGC